MYSFLRWSVFYRFSQDDAVDRKEIRGLAFQLFVLSTSKMSDSAFRLFLLPYLSGSQPQLPNYESGVASLVSVCRDCHRYHLERQFEKRVDRRDASESRAFQAVVLRSVGVGEPQTKQR